MKIERMRKMSILHHAIRKKLTSDMISTNVSVLLHFYGNAIDDTGHIHLGMCQEPIIIIC